MYGTQPIKLTVTGRALAALRSTAEPGVVGQELFAGAAELFFVGGPHGLHVPGVASEKRLGCRHGCGRLDRLDWDGGFNLADRAQAAGLAHAAIRLWRTTCAAGSHHAALLCWAIPHRHAALAAASHAGRAVVATWAECVFAGRERVTCLDNHAIFEVAFAVLRARGPSLLCVHGRLWWERVHRQVHARGGGARGACHNVGAMACWVRCRLQPNLPTIVYYIE